jgi:hypothetical protein
MAAHGIPGQRENASWENASPRERRWGPLPGRTAGHPVSADRDEAGSADGWPWGCERGNAGSRRAVRGDVCPVAPGEPLAVLLVSGMRLVSFGAISVPLRPSCATTPMAHGCVSFGVRFRRTARVAGRRCWGY